MDITAIILAAGKGTRMKSPLPKVLHSIGGKPMVEHVLATSKELGAAKSVVVYGYGGDQVQQALANSEVEMVEQTEQLGTGHAVAQALPLIADDDVAVVLYGDVPLVTAPLLQKLVDIAKGGKLALLTVKLDQPAGYGRIVRDGDGKVVAIVEHKDANSEQLIINEVNTGILAVSGRLLQEELPKLSNSNAQGEYYLTDVIAAAVAAGVTVEAVIAPEPVEVEGVNDLLQLATLERAYQLRQAQNLMRQGCKIMDPARFDLRGRLSTGQQCLIDVNCIFIGDVTLGDNVSVEANCHIINCTIASGVTIKANSHLEGAVIADGCEIGPYARIRPGTQLMSGAKIGNFVETKKTLVGEDSKINHLSYVGDAILGKEVNVGAGTITCNYDGVNKFTTEMGDHAFIGSNSSLVAPVRIGKNATTGAGSTITTDVEDNSLSVGRGKQRNITGWNRPTKK